MGKYEFITIFAIYNLKGGCLSTALVRQITLKGGLSYLLPVGLLSSAAAPGTAPAVAADGPAPAPTAPVPPLLPLAHAPYPRPPGPSEMFSESTGR